MKCKKCKEDMVWRSKKDKDDERYLIAICPNCSGWGLTPDTVQRRVLRARKGRGRDLALLRLLADAAEAAHDNDE